MSEFDVFARFYDADYGDFQDDSLLYRGFAERTGGPLLELACGTGRLLVPLAQAGYEITGVDVSPALLSLARRKIEAAGLQQRVTLVEADMSDFRLDRRFRLAFVAINSFMHLLTTEDQLRALRCWREHLTPEGFLILDLFHPHPQELLEADGRLVVNRQWKDPQTGAMVIKQCSRTLNLARQTLEVTFVYDEIFPDGRSRRTVAPFRMRYLHRFEMELLLRLAGYELEQLYGSYELDPFRSDSERMIFVARKGEVGAPSLLEHKA